MKKMDVVYAEIESAFYKVPENDMLMIICVLMLVLLNASIFKMCWKNTGLGKKRKGEIFIKCATDNGLSVSNTTFRHCP